MIKLRPLFFVLAIIIFFIPSKSKAQTIELLAGSTLNGAVNGTILGGATMGLTGNSQFGPLRIGLGLGTLYGVGTGAYDLSETNGGPIHVSGIFNDGTNSSVIVLLDTFYGAAAGSIVVTAVMLVANEPLVNGLRYGASIGAWAGFGVGLVDAFMLSERTATTVVSHSTNNKASGLIGISFNNFNHSVGLLDPGITQSIDFGDLSKKATPTVNLINYRLNF